MAGAPPARAGGRFAERLRVPPESGATLALAAGGDGRQGALHLGDFIADKLQHPLSRKHVKLRQREHHNQLSRLFTEFSQDPFSTYL